MVKGLILAKALDIPLDIPAAMPKRSLLSWSSWTMEASFLPRLSNSFFVVFLSYENDVTILDWISMYLHLGLIFEMGRFAISVEQRQQVSPGCVRHRPNVSLLVRDANETGQQEQCHLHFLSTIEWMNWINKKVGQIQQFQYNPNSSSFVFSLSTSFVLYNPSFSFTWSSSTSVRN